MISKSDQILISKVAHKIVIHGMAVPAIFFLEMIKYMSFISSQLLVFFGPVITSFINSSSYYRVTNLLEERQNVEFLMLEIEKIIAMSKAKG